MYGIVAKSGRTHTKWASFPLQIRTHFLPFVGLEIFTAGQVPHLVNATRDALAALPASATLPPASINPHDGNGPAVSVNMAILGRRGKATKF